MDPEAPVLAKRRPELTVVSRRSPRATPSDCVALALEAAGAGRYLVELGGELRARGRNGSGAPWCVAIEAPGRRTHMTSRVLGLESGSVVTSGEYRNSRIVDGARISPTIAPRTGRLIAHRLAAVTVVEPELRPHRRAGHGAQRARPRGGLAVEQDLAVLFQIGVEGGAFEARASPSFERRFGAKSAQ